MTTTTEDSTEEATEEPLRRASDTAIACQLLRVGYIRSEQHDAWQRSRAGESIWSMRRDYPNHARGGLPFAASRLYVWVQQVDAAIAAARVAEEPAEGERSPWGISIASGHDVRLAADGTPQGKIPTEQSTWDAERLRAAGVVDRYSRKRG